VTGVIELTEIGPAQDVSDDQLRERHIHGSKNSFTHHFIARVGNFDVGFLAADIDPEAEYFIIYELFIPSHLRNRGYGTALLRQAEMLGRGLGYRHALLRARTLDGSFPQHDLEAWYQRSGYTVLPDSYGALVKLLK
jgi:GNAT superfamily N-acetyltransferase